MAKNLGAGQNINIRFTDRLLEQIDACVAELVAKNPPGATFTRSDVVRMAVEDFTAPAKHKRAAGR